MKQNNIHTYHRTPILTLLLLYQIKQITLLASLISIELGATSFKEHKIIQLKYTIEKKSWEVEAEKKRNVLNETKSTIEKKLYIICVFIQININRDSEWVSEF